MRKGEADRDGIQPLTGLHRLNTRNDVLLHQLVQTRILEPLDHTDHTKPAHKRKAVEGRVMELTGAVKVGKGEAQLRKCEQNSASKRVREGLAAKEAQVIAKQREEVRGTSSCDPTTITDIFPGEKHRNVSPLDQRALQT